jgi:hypothetical protein
MISTFSGCATIVSKSLWPCSISTNPAGAKVSIRNKKDIEIYSGRTPATVSLKSGSGFFGRASYSVKLEMDGYESKTVNLECKLNGWYFGNLLIGGWIGMLIVDPATGAMYRLADKEVYENLVSKSSTLNIGNPTLMILDKGKLSQEEKNNLVEIGK